MQRNLTRTHLLKLVRRLRWETHAYEGNPTRHAVLQECLLQAKAMLAETPLSRSKVRFCDSREVSCRHAAA